MVIVCFTLNFRKNGTYAIQHQIVTCTLLLCRNVTSVKGMFNLYLIIIEETEEFENNASPNNTIYVNTLCINIYVSSK